MNMLLGLQIHIEILLHESRNECDSTFFILDLDYVIFFDLEFSDEMTIFILVWMRIQHIVAQKHVSSMIHKILVGYVFVLILLKNFSDENADSHTPFDPCHSETDTFTGSDWYWVIS